MTESLVELIGLFRANRGRWMPAHRLQDVNTSPGLSVATLRQRGFFIAHRSVLAFDPRAGRNQFISEYQFRGERNEQPKDTPAGYTQQHQEGASTDAS